MLDVRKTHLHTECAKATVGEGNIRITILTRFQDRQQLCGMHGSRSRRAKTKARTHEGKVTLGAMARRV